MEINKEHLKKKLKEYVEKRNQAQDQIQKWDLIFKKYAGAVESTEILLNEIAEPKPDPNLKPKK
jgi:hypothetical protein